MAEQKIALVTGASRGIGAALAERLAADDYHVVLTARTEAGLIETEDRIHAAGGSATIAPLDITKSEEVDRLAAAIAGRWEKLDLLVLNAATLGELAPLAHVSPKEFDKVMVLNVTAQWRLIRDFDAMLRRARGTVVAISSSVAGRHEAYWGPYAASKAALESLVGVYAAEMQALGVNALIVDPGGTRTSMRAKAYPGEDPQTLKTPDTVARAIVDALPAIGPGASRLKISRDGQSSLTG
ncbi:SDR family NAD(P)-dependent oxidoreductase [Sandaracinobacter sp. RS1-74]|uniref:SDR family NAD(P)-dependent oxidoreductase n=1 Tax=Sandaracinobacteroides sayramensis TaxID=2913411 RepID=UPI001EDA15BF|nr:SDR family NAD(P)-dependent oxidoreductase [Sandaracinobacteroides sayramensis]MCG2840023.1 SDR family NAD(P)-dependent oxidoreductase [Sandaracinobacteroides sayramensis]